MKISVTGIAVRFGGVAALQGVDLELDGPGVVGVMGPNGSGKSTLLNVLSGLQRPTEGDTFVDGVPMTGQATRRYAHAGVGRTFQTVRLVNDLKVRDNIRVGEPPRSRRRAATADAPAMSLEDAAAELDLVAHLDRWPDELPYGIQRRVEVARVVMRGARMILLDEPSAGMRVDEAEEIGEVVLKLARTRLVVLVDHYVDLMVRVCARVVVLDQGQVIADGDPDETLRSAVVRRAYFGS
jgi:ABC-type branched-subunit amino acid transport system ATPase component